MHYTQIFISKLLDIMNRSFQHSGDCYGETVESINWLTLEKTEPTMRVNGACVVVRLCPQGTGFVFFHIKDGRLYLRWECDNTDFIVPFESSWQYKTLYKAIEEISK